MGSSIGHVAQMNMDGVMSVGRWYSANEIAEHLGITVTTLYKWLQGKELPAHKVGRLWKFKIDEIDAWVKSDKSSSSNQKQEEKFDRSAKCVHRKSTVPTST
jgi:excisionase family DNA binding protein